MQESFLIFGDLGTFLGDNPLKSTDYYIQRRPPSAPLKRNSDGGLTIWVYVCYALCLPMLVLWIVIGAISHKFYSHSIVEGGLEEMS